MLFENPKLDLTCAMLAVGYTKKEASTQMRRKNVSKQKTRLMDAMNTNAKQTRKKSLSSLKKRCQVFLYSA